MSESSAVAVTSDKTGVAAVAREAGSARDPSSVPPAAPEQMVADMAAAGSRWRGWMAAGNEGLVEARADPASYQERPPLTSDEEFDAIAKELKETDRQALERQDAADPATRQERPDVGNRKSPDSGAGPGPSAGGPAADPGSRAERGDPAPPETGDTP